VIKKETVRSSLHTVFQSVEERAVVEYHSYLKKVDEDAKRWFAEELRKENDLRRIHGLKPIKRLRLEHVQRVFDDD
jgi:type III secretory pathway component EscR